MFMKLLIFLVSLSIALVASFLYTSQSRFYAFKTFVFQQKPIETTESLVNSTMSKGLAHAKIIPRRSGDRGHGEYGWLNTYHTFRFVPLYCFFQLIIYQEIWLSLKVLQIITSRNSRNLDRCEFSTKIESMPNLVFVSDIPEELSPDLG
jgi:hypothetical protein